MLNILLTTLGIFTPFIFGAIFLSFFRRLQLNWIEFFILSFAFGSIFLTILIFTLSLFDLSLTLIKNIIFCFSFFGLFFLIIRFFCCRPLSLAVGSDPRLPNSFLARILIICLIFIIIFKIFFISIESLLRPIFQYDAIATWSLRAKNFFLENRLNLNPNQPHFLGSAYFSYSPEGDHLNYPLHLPLLQTWVALLFNSWSEILIKIIFLLHYLGLLGIFYFNLRRYLSFTKTIIFTFFLTTLPFFVYHAIHDYVDLPLSFYLLGALIYLWRETKEDNPSYLVFGALFLTGAAWTKNEGFFLGLIILFSSFICQLINKRFKFKFLISYLLFLIFQLPWLIFKFIYQLGFENTTIQFVFKPSILKILFLRLIETINWNIWWLLFLFVLIFNWQKIWKQDLRFMSMIVFLSIGFYLAIYVFTSNFQFIVNSMVDQRNLLTIVPLTIFYTGILFSEEGRDV